ncbi:MAG: archaemetzincin [Candidatus Altiarchaeia archaeon]
MTIQVFYAKSCEKYVRGICKELEEVYSLRCFRNEVLEVIPPAYSAQRKQYDAASLLEYMSRMKQAENALWIVDKDIYTKNTSFVFGYAAKNYGAVLSAYRLKSEDLIQKEALHEVGHIIGLSHCENRCFMRFSNCLEDVRMKPVRLCDSCSGACARLVKAR